jgi:hypothetical protein
MFLMMKLLSFLVSQERVFKSRAGSFFRLRFLAVFFSAPSLGFGAGPGFVFLMPLLQL